MLDVNLKNKAVTQSTRNFNSMCRFGNDFLGANSAGLYRICGYSDSGTEVPATIRSGTFDLGTERFKRFAYIYIGLETTGDLELDILCDGEFMCTLDIPYPGAGKREVYVKVPRGLKARYWAWELRNVNGSFFVLYSVKLLPVVLQSAK